MGLCALPNPCMSLENPHGCARSTGCPSLSQGTAKAQEMSGTRSCSNPSLVFPPPVPTWFLLCPLVGVLAFRPGFLALGGELGKWWRGGLGMGRAPAGSGFTASPFLQCCWKSQAEQGWRFTAEGFAILPFPSVSVRWLWSRASELPSWCFWASRCLWELSEPCTVLCLCH